MPSLLTADSISADLLNGQPQWGIYGQDGSSVLPADSVFSVEYGRDYHIADAQQEQGAFESYNKVQRPFQAKVVFIVAESRFDFLNVVERAVASLLFVTVVTPEISYPSANLIHYGYRRESRNGGMTLLHVDVWCEEVRIVNAATTTTAATGTPAPSGTQSPSGAPKIDNGSVQASATGTAQVGSGSVIALNPPT